jgi:transcriptional regulator with XRE-family HTH domain
MVAEKVGITPASFSRILTGTVRPRQGTFTKLFEALSANSREEQLLLSSYSELPEHISEDHPAPIGPNGELLPSELERVARYLEMKALAVNFKKSVAQTLRSHRIVFQEDVIANSVIADFLVKQPCIAALECKFNVNRDWDRELATVQILRSQLPCDHVVIVVPFQNTLASEITSALKTSGATLATVTELAVVLCELT